jgi:hypothetical protein
MVVLSGEEHGAGNGSLIVFNRNQENIVLVCYCQTGIGGTEINTAKKQKLSSFEKLGAQFLIICPAMQINVAIRTRTCRQLTRTELFFI